MVLCNLCRRSLVDSNPATVVLACPHHIYHLNCNVVASSCAVCATGPYVATCIDDTTHLCALCFVDRAHNTKTCIQKIVDTITHTIQCSVAGLELGPEISRVLASQSVTRIKNTHYLAFLRKTLTALLLQSLDEYAPGVVRSQHATKLIALKQQVPNNGRWHRTNNISMDFITWLKSTEKTGMSVRKKTGAIEIRHDTPYNIDTIQQLQTTLAEMYPAGLDKHTLYCEHVDMHTWLLELADKLVVIEGEKDSSIVYCPAATPDSIHAAVVHLHGAPCAMLLDAVRERPNFDFLCLPQIHSTVRAAIIADLFAANLIVAVGGVRLGAPTLIGANNAQLLLQFSTQIGAEKQNSDDINTTHKTMTTNRRRTSMFVNKRFRPGRL